MALEFRKRRFRKPSKKTQYFLAFAALLLVLTLVALWGLIRFKLGEMHNGNSSDDSSTSLPEISYTADDKGNLLCIVTDEENDRFFLVQSDPARKSIHLMAIPRMLTIKNEQTLTALYRKNGAASVANALADVLQLSIKHHLTISTDNVEKWATRLDSGLNFSLKNTVTYTDENNAAIPLSAGQHTLTAAQISHLLLNDNCGTDIFVAIINQYMTNAIHLPTEFAALSNLVQTDLRIGDFNDYREILSYLAENNDGALCKKLSLPTKRIKNRIVPDTSILKKCAVLYE